MKTSALGPAPKRRGYSILEVLVAGAVLVIAISAAAILARALMAQQQTSGFALRAFNAQEQAARLWQLGVSTNNITNILPERCAASSPPPAFSIFLQFTTVSSNLPGVGNVEMLSPLRVVFHSGTRPDGTLTYRTNDVIVVRPTIR